MTIYLFALLSIFFLFGIFKNKLSYILFGLILFFISILRSENVGYDYITYEEAYHDFAVASWSDLFFVRIRFEPGYVLFNKCLTIISSNYLLFKVVTSFINICSVLIFIKRYSVMPWMSCALFLTLGFYNFELNIMRQSLALSISLFAYPYAENKSLLKFLLCIILATLFHYSAIILLIIYPIANIKFTKRKIFIEISLILLTIYLFGHLFLSFVSSTWSISYDKNSGTGYGMLGMLSLILIFSLYINFRIENQISKIPLHMMIVACCFQILSLDFSMFVRIVQYFSIGAIVLLPNSIFLLKVYRPIYLLAILFLLLITTYYWVGIILYLDMDGTVPYSTIL